jgi:hypothetical protein
MIRIRYRGSNELSPGLHAEAEQRGRRITVYLLSGLTAAQRRSALRRLRLTARMGHCPRLPAGQLAFALLMDRIRTGIGRTGAVLRLHPAGSTVPIMVLSGGAIAFLLFSTVSIHVLRPQTANQSDAGTSPVISASAIALGGGPPGQGGRGGSGNPGGQADRGRGSRGSDTGQLTRPTDAPVTTSPALAAGDPGTASRAGSADASSSGTGSSGTGSGNTGSGGTGSGGSATDTGSKSSGSSGGGTTLSGSANRNPVAPQQSTPATSAGAAAPAATVPATTPATSGSGSSSGSSSGTSNGVCVNVGPLGVCLNI